MTHVTFVKLFETMDDEAWDLLGALATPCSPAYFSGFSILSAFTHANVMHHNMHHGEMVNHSPKLFETVDVEADEYLLRFVTYTTYCTNL